MGVYDRRSRRSFEGDLALIISDQPTKVTRTRKTHPDKLRAPVVAEAGPFTVRIDAFRATRSAVTFDEKGTGATAAYILVGLDIPREQAPNVPTFLVGDTLTDTDGNEYRITAPARFQGRAVELNIELLG